MHGCDGPDALGSPGVCYDLGAGQGVCLPACTFPTDGSAPRGCTGKDVCNFYGQGTNPSTGQPYGIGYCLGGCTADADCPTGSVCEADTGLCQSTRTPPALPLGSACNASAQDPGCNCFGNPTTGAGYCVQFCITGSTTAVCPAGYLCDSTEPALSADGGASGFATQTPGLAGFCLARCEAPSAGADAGGLFDAAARSDASGDGEASDGSLGATDGLDTGATDGLDTGATDGLDTGATDASAAPDGAPDGPSDADGGASSACPGASVCGRGNVAGQDCLP